MCDKAETVSFRFCSSLQPQ